MNNNPYSNLNRRSRAISLGLSCILLFSMLFAPLNALACDAKMQQVDVASSQTAPCHDMGMMDAVMSMDHSCCQADCDCEQPLFSLTDASLASGQFFFPPWQTALTPAFINISASRLDRPPAAFFS